MTPRTAFCSYLACAVIFGALAGLELFDPSLGGKTAAYVWMGALSMAGALLLVAWLRCEEARHRRLAMGIWFLLMVASLLA